MNDKQEQPPIQEKAQEISVSSKDVRTFAGSLLQNVVSVSEGKSLEELSLDDTQKKLAEGIMPSFQTALEQTAKDSQKLVPKDGAEAILWLATGIRLSNNASHLDRYTGSLDQLDKLNTMSDETSIQVTSEDLSEVGRILGNLVTYHSVVNRPFSKIKPNLGDLFEERSKLLTTSKDRLLLLDTMVDQLRAKYSSETK